MDKKDKRTVLENEIKDFIKNFSKYPDSKEMFLCGCCYWFAYILKGRFPKGEIWYDEIDNHFMLYYIGKIWDIRGDITGLYPYATPWDKFEEYDSLLYERIVRDCIRKEKCD